MNHEGHQSQQNHCWDYHKPHDLPLEDRQTPRRTFLAHNEEEEQGRSHFSFLHSHKLDWFKTSSSWSQGWRNKHEAGNQVVKTGNVWSASWNLTLGLMFSSWPTFHILPGGNNVFACICVCKFICHYLKSLVFIKTVHISHTLSCQSFKLVRSSYVEKIICAVLINPWAAMVILETLGFCSVFSCGRQFESGWVKLLTSHTGTSND